MANSNDTWYPLDNAANIFPAISGDKNTNVFRLSCTLNELIDKDTLQKALDLSLADFPYFRVIMRRGLFWYYLEKTDLSPVVEYESERPCRRLFYKGVKELLFRVSYFGRRINLEVFHSVSDGVGAINFLRMIVYRYIALVHRDEFASFPLPDGEYTPEQQAEDSFDRYYTDDKKDSVFKKKSYIIGGTVLPGGNIKIIEARVSTKSVLGLAKSKGVTITAYMTTLMLLAIYSELMPRRAVGKTVAVTVPVDLRGHFSSRSARNFFSVVSIGYNFSQGEATFDAVLESVCAQLKDLTHPDELAGRINYTMGVQKNLATRFTPLVLKNWILKGAYNKSERSCTCALSNLGRVTMPEALSPYIDTFSCMLNPTGIHRLKLTMCSYGDEFNFTFTSCIAETDAQTMFFRHLAQAGLDLTITCNGGYDDEVL